jgi:iron complex outermembrane receptor protein
MLRWLVSFSALFIWFSSAGQTGILKGKVTDANTKESLPGAVIMNDRTSKGVVTDIDGVFSIVLDTGKQVLHCSMLGYTTDSFVVEIGNNTIVDKEIMLLQQKNLLNMVVVSSGKFDQLYEELTISMEVLRPELISNKNTTSIETALEQVPGLTIIDNDPQIRGGSGFTFGVGSRVAIVSDGIPLLSGDAGRPEWSYIPVENIEQVEVIKGASSVLYGSSALNGVINIRSAYPRSTPKTIINYSVGNYSFPAAPAESWYNKSTRGMTNLNLLHSRIVKKNLDLVIGGNFNMDQGYIGPPPPTPYMPQEIKDAFMISDSIPVFSNQDMMKVRGRINFNLRYRSKKVTGLNFGINGNGMVNKTNLVFAWLDDSLGIYRGYPGAVFLENQKIFNLDPFIKYSKGNGISHSFVSRIFHSDNFITNNISNRGTLYYGEYQLQRIFREQEFTFTGGVVGSMATSYAQLYAASGSPNNKISNVSGYIQIDKKLWKLLNISGGFRYEYFRMNASQSVVAPIFRAGASLQVMKGTFVRASYGQGFRYPTITERFISTKAGLFGVFPNPDLKPETSKSFEVGLKQGFKIGAVKGYLDVAGFYQHYENTIEYLFGVWDPSVALLGFKFLNTGDSRVRGVDMSLAASSPMDNNVALTMLAGYTFVEPVSLTPDSVYARDKSLGGVGTDLSYKSSSMDTTGNILKYRFKHMFKADMELKLWSFGLGVSYRYYSRMQNIDRAFKDVEELTSNAAPYLYEIKATNYWKKNNGFQIWDARLSFKIDEKQKISVVCNNLLNANYSLRPLKIEAPRTTSVQYVYTF